MNLRLTGACRGEGRAYALLEVPGEPEAYRSCRAKLSTSAGGELPAELYALCLKPGEPPCTVVSFPLFTCESVTLVVLGASDGLPRGRAKITRSGLALRSRANALAHQGLCGLVRNSEKRARGRRARAEFVQVLEGESSQRVLRLHVVAPQPCAASDIVVRDGRGLPIAECAPRFVEPWHACGQGASRAAAGGDAGGSDVGSDAGGDPGGADASRAAGAVAASAYGGRVEPCVEAVASLAVPRDVKDVSAEVLGTFASLDEGRFNWLVGVRDSLMANPGIDKRYARFVSVAPPNVCAAPHAEQDAAAAAPLFSIVAPLFDTPPSFLRDMIDSVRAQSFSSWELVLVNASPGRIEMREVIDSYRDGRIRELAVPENRGIAPNTNVGIRAARGSYLAFLDHDDVLEPNALAAYAREIACNPNVDVLYCDEDSFSDTSSPCFRPLLKPDPNRSLLYSHNYFLHFLAVSRFVIERTGLADEDSSGAQDYDLVLKALDAAREVRHVPELLYHWRMHEGSTNGGVMEGKPYAEQAAIRSLARHFKRRGLDVDVVDVDIPGVYCIDYRRVGACAQVSAIIVPTRWELGGNALESIAGSADLAPIREVVVVEHGAGRYAGERMAGARARLEARGVAVRVAHAEGRVDGGVDFAQAVNAGASRATGEILLVCADVVSGDVVSCAQQLAGCLARGEVGVVAPRLLYEDGLVQHAGLCIREDATIGYLNQNFTSNMGGGYHGAAECSCDYSAAGPDCLAFRAADFQAVGGMSSLGGSAEIEAVDFCFKMRAHMRKSVTVLPDATLVTRALVLWQDRVADFADPHSEGVRALWERWGGDMRVDVLANPHVELGSSYFRLAGDADAS